MSDVGEQGPEIYTGRLLPETTPDDYHIIMHEAARNPNYFAEFLARIGSVDFDPEMARRIQSEAEKLAANVIKAEGSNLDPYWLIKEGGAAIGIMVYAAMHRRLQVLDMNARLALTVSEPKGDILDVYEVNELESPERES